MTASSAREQDLNLKEPSQPKSIQLILHVKRNVIAFLLVVFPKVC